MLARPVDAIWVSWLFVEPRITSPAIAATSAAPPPITAANTTRPWPRRSDRGSPGPGSGSGVSLMLIASVGEVDEPVPGPVAGSALAFGDAAAVVLGALAAGAGVALDRGQRGGVVDDAGVIVGDEGVVAGADLGRVGGVAAVDARPLLGQAGVVGHAGRAGAADAVAPRRADGEARAPRHPVGAVDALLPARRLRAAAVGAGRVLRDAELLLEPAFAVRPRPAPAAAGAAVLGGAGGGVVGGRPRLVVGAVLGRDAQVLVAQFSFSFVPARVLAEVPDLFAAVGQPVAVVLAPRLGLRVDRVDAPPHLALGDLGLLRRGAAVARKLAQPPAGPRVERLVLELVIASGAVVDVPARPARARLLALGAAPDLFALGDQPVAGGLFGGGLAVGEAVPVRQLAQAGVDVPVGLLGRRQVGVVVAHQPTRTGRASSHRSLIWTLLPLVEYQRTRGLSAGLKARRSSRPAVKKMPPFQPVTPAGVERWMSGPVGLVAPSATPACWVMLIWVSANLAPHSRS